MKAHSNNIPNRFIKSAGKTHFNYNIHEVTIEEPDGTSRTAYEYEYVEIEGTVTKAKILKALDDTKLNTEEEFTPTDIESQYNESKEAIKLSEITNLTYKQLDTYINNNVNNLSEAKAYLKKLSKVVLAMMKMQDL